MQELTTKLVYLMLILPLLTELRKPSIKPRHWEYYYLIGKRLPYTDEDAFLLHHILDSTVKEEVEELCDGADKQLSIDSRTTGRLLHLNLLY